MKISRNKPVIIALSVGLTLTFLGCKSGYDTKMNLYSAKKVDMLNNCLNAGYLYDLGEVTEQQMADSIYSNYVGMLENPATYYLDQDMLEQAKVSDEGKYIGTGLTLTWETDGRSLVVTGVIKNSSADKAGVETGERIISVDDIEINGATQLDILDKIRYIGEDTVKYVFKDDKGKLKDVLLKATKINVPDATLKMYGNVGYVDVEHITNNTSSNIADMLAEIDEQSGEGVILDLRGVYTNNLEEASKIADLFLEEGTAFKAKGKQDIDRFNMTAGSYEDKVVIITDGYTTGGTEALVSALKEVGTQVGSDTSGLSYISEIIELGDGTGLRVATKTLYDRYGDQLPEGGIEPDEQVFISEAETIEYMETGTISEENDSFIKVALDQFN